MIIIALQFFRSRIRVKTLKVALFHVQILPSNNCHRPKKMINYGSKKNTNIGGQSISFNYRQRIIRKNFM